MPCRPLVDLTTSQVRVDGGAFDPRGHSIIQTSDPHLRPLEALVAAHRAGAFSEADYASPVPWIHFPLQQSSLEDMDVQHTMHGCHGGCLTPIQIG